MPKQKIPKKYVPYTRIEPLIIRLKNVANENGYSGFFGILSYTIKYLNNFYLNILANIVPSSELRVIFHRARGVKIGENVLIGYNVIIDNSYPFLISIGDGVSLAGNNLILAHSKPLLFHKNILKSYIAPVIIEKNVWITVGVIILSGVRIGEGSIITAGSVVTKDIPPYSLAGGIPAKVIKKYEINDLSCVKR